MAKLYRVQAIGIKTETTVVAGVMQNNAATLAATDFIVAMNIDLNVNPEVLNRDFLRASMSNLDHVIGKRYVTVKFKTELKASGVAGTVYAPLDAALQACALISAGPVVTGIQSVTITNPGTTPYTSAPTVAFGGGGTGAAGIATINAAGQVTGVIVTAPGTGYSAPTCTLSSGGGTGATASATASSTVSYAPTSVVNSSYFGPGKSCTIVVNKNGVNHQIVGCVGTVKFTLTSGHFGELDFEFHGIYAGPTDTAVPTTTYVSQYPAIWANSAVSVQGFQAVIDKLEFDLTNTLAQRDDAGSVNSIKGYLITDRDPKGSLDVEFEAVATHDFFGKLMASNSAAVGLTLGATGGNIIHISMPKVQYSDVNYAERNKILTVTVPIQINGNTGDDEISIVFA